jgi:pyrroloquinoline quinone biosynthesis protein A
MYREHPSYSPERSTFMSWSKPAYTDLRIGFEVTMYFASR